MCLLASMQATKDPANRLGFIVDATATCRFAFGEIRLLIRWLESTNYWRDKIINTLLLKINVDSTSIRQNPGWISLITFTALCIVQGNIYSIGLRVSWPATKLLTLNVYCSVLKSNIYFLLTTKIEGRNEALAARYKRFCYTNKIIS